MENDEERCGNVSLQLAECDINKGESIRIPPVQMINDEKFGFVQVLAVTGVDTRTRNKQSDGTATFYSGLKNQKFGFVQVMAVTGVDTRTRNKQSDGTATLYSALKNHLFMGTDAREHLAYLDVTQRPNVIKDFTLSDMSRKYQVYNNSLLVSYLGSLCIADEAENYLDKVQMPISTEGFAIALYNMEPQTRGATDIFIGGLGLPNEPPDVFCVEFFNDWPNTSKYKRLTRIDTSRQGVASGSGGKIADQLMLKWKPNLTPDDIKDRVTCALTAGMLEDIKTGVYATVIHLYPTLTGEMEHRIYLSSSIDNMIKYYRRLPFNLLLFLFYDDDEKNVGDPFFTSWIKEHALPTYTGESEMLSPIGKIWGTNLVFRCGRLNSEEDVVATWEFASQQPQLEEFPHLLPGPVASVSHKGRRFFVSQPSPHLLKSLRPILLRLNETNEAVRIGATEEDYHDDPNYCIPGLENNGGFLHLMGEN